MPVRLLQGAVDDLTDIKSSDKNLHTTKKLLKQSWRQSAKTYWHVPPRQKCRE
jgi:hypothetical protein